MTMIATIHRFTQALLLPDLSFATLADARAVTDAHGMPCLQRTTRFAEAQIEWQGRRWLLSLPLSPSALLRIERMASELRRLNTEWLNAYRILPQELHWLTESGEEATCDLLIEELPDGYDFEQARQHATTEQLLTALDRLETELRALHFCHNNLKASNLRWTGRAWRAMRYHDATVGDTACDRAAFEQLRQALLAVADAATVNDIEAFYTAHSRLIGHRWVSHVFEGLVCVEDETGFGFVDTDNNPVIKAQYLWAGDFREGRAEVQTPTGMGLIDRQGCYVIEPRYEIVDYAPAESRVRVRLNGRWKTFDYLGREIKK